MWRELGLHGTGILWGEEGLPRAPQMSHIWLRLGLSDAAFIEDALG